jgi:hypothetical protein
MAWTREPATRRWWSARRWAGPRRCRPFSSSAPPSTAQVSNCEWTARRWTGLSSWIRPCGKPSRSTWCPTPSSTPSPARLPSPCDSGPATSSCRSPTPAPASRSRHRAPVHPVPPDRGGAGPQPRRDRHRPGPRAAARRPAPRQCPRPQHPRHWQHLHRLGAYNQSRQLHSPRAPAPDAASTASTARLSRQAYADDAQLWLDGDAVPASVLDEPPPQPVLPGKRPVVLVVGDNPDMRRYLNRLLSDR